MNLKQHRADGKVMHPMTFLQAFEFMRASVDDWILEAEDGRQFYIDGYDDLYEGIFDKKFKKVTFHIFERAIDELMCMKFKKSKMANTKEEL